MIDAEPRAGPPDVRAWGSTFPAGWAVPPHEATVFGPRRSRFAVIIPVWNEAERLERQLLAMRGQQGVADVVVADGDSSDGSTDPGLLARNGVRAVVRVRERGVGTALRPALAHALLDGYEGVILMDGNGKDDPAMIGSFARALEDGADYAQGTRYIRGGRGINTPRLRELLIRGVHSPLFSLAARRWFTDTTIGSRAFSRRFLLDARVRPFRGRFRHYDIYFFLAWAACRLGARVVDVPVTRTYPERGRTPTKIRSPRAYWRMIGPLFRLLLGRYDLE